MVPNVLHKPLRFVSMILFSLATTLSLGNGRSGIKYQVQFCSIIGTVLYWMRVGLHLFALLKNYCLTICRPPDSQQKYGHLEGTSMASSKVQMDFDRYSHAESIVWPRKFVLLSTRLSLWWHNYVWNTYYWTVEKGKRRSCHWSPKAPLHHHCSSVTEICCRTVCALGHQAHTWVHTSRAYAIQRAGSFDCNCLGRRH